MNLDLGFHLYGLIVGLSFVSVFVVAEFALVSVPDSEKKTATQLLDRLFFLMPLLALGSLFLSRVTHVMIEAPYYAEVGWERSLYIWEGGLSILGILPACFLLGAWTLMRSKPLASALAIGGLFGQGIGRVANLVQSEHFGWWAVPWIELMIFVPLSLAMMVWVRRKPALLSSWWIMSLTLVSWGVVRMALDQVRTDASWFGLLITGVSVLLGGILGLCQVYQSLLLSKNSSTRRVLSILCLRKIFPHNTQPRNPRQS